MIESAKEHAKKLRNLATSLLAGAAALESRPKVLHEAWSIVGTTGNLAGVQSGTPLLFFATQEEANEAAKFRPRPFRAVRAQIVEAPS